MNRGAGRAVAAVAVAIAAGCAQLPAGEAGYRAASRVVPMTTPAVIPLKNADFEAELAPGKDCPPSWGCSAHANSRAFAFEVKSDPPPRGRYLRVTRVLPEPWALVNQLVPAQRMVGARLRLSVSVHGESLEGLAGPMIILQGESGRVIDHRKTLLAPGPGWRRATVEIDIAPDTEQIECALAVEGGGAVGFDDVEAVLLPREGS